MFHKICFWLHYICTITYRKFYLPSRNPKGSFPKRYKITILFIYLPHRINIAMRFNFNTIFYVQYRSEEISPPEHHGDHLHAEKGRDNVQHNTEYDGDHQHVDCRRRRRSSQTQSRMSRLSPLYCTMCEKSKSTTFS